MAYDLRCGRDEVEVNSENLSGMDREKPIGLKNSDESTKEMNDSLSLGTCAMEEVNNTGCNDDISYCTPSEHPKYIDGDLAEDNQNDLLPEEALLQDPPENVATRIFEILPEDPINPVIAQPNVQLEEETAVVNEASASEIETQTESSKPLESDNEMEFESELPKANTINSEADMFEIGGGNNESDMKFSGTNEIRTQNESALPLEDADDLMHVESVLPAENVTDGEINTCEVGGNNDIEMNDGFEDGQEPCSSKNSVIGKELDCEILLLSDDTYSTPEANKETSLDDETERMSQDNNIEGSSPPHVPFVTSPVKSLNEDMAHEKSVSQEEEVMTLSQNDSFLDAVDFCHTTAADKNTNESNDADVLRKPETDLGANVAEELKITEDLESSETVCKSSTEESNNDDLNLRADVEQTSTDLELGQDSLDFTDSIDRRETGASDADNGCGSQLVEDEGLKDAGRFSKLATEIPKTSDASNDTILASEYSPGHNLRSDDLHDLKNSHNSDDTVKEDCNFSDASNEKSNHSERSEVSAVNSTEVIDKKVADSDATVSEKTLLKSSVNEDVEVIDIKEEQDKHSTINDEPKTDLQSNVSETGSKSARSRTGTSSSRSQQKTGKSSQTSKGSKQQECIVCKKITKCKYNIVRNDDTKHLCDDKCFQLFRTQPTTYLQADGKKPGSTELCPQCQKPVPASVKGRSTLKVDKELKKFCSTACLNVFKKAMKPCANCGKDLQNDVSAVTAPIEGDGNKDFCCHACLVKYEHSRKQATKIEDDDDDDVKIVETTPAPKIKTPSTRNSGVAKSNCSICSKHAIVRREVHFKGAMYKLCGDACFSAFRVMHRLSVDHCDQCNGMYSLDDGLVQTIQFEGLSKTFCCARCLSSFKSKKQRVVPCAWCKTKKSNFDMVERLDANNKFQMFCSLNCLSLYRVNLQANSNQSVACDQCHKYEPALYHLTMSDASVRNFCGYNCVMAFQAQFSQPSATYGEIPTPGDRVTVNAANTQLAQSAVPPSQPARNSPYGTRKSIKAKSTTPLKPAPQMQSPTMPVISNIMSLAVASPASHPDNAATSKILIAHSGAQTMTSHELIVQPTPPKQVKNKALLCKPFMQTKATSCRPHTVMKGSQTEENWEPSKLVVPCPVPTLTPAPMMMYSHPVPYPILLPIPVPIPVFIPTTRKSSAGILKKLKELQERVPSDPFEAELLMMAEAVASANKASNSDSESDNDTDGNDVHIETVDNAVIPSARTQGRNGESAEDMLQMALRMAEMHNEQTLDLEDSVDPSPVRAREPVAPGALQVFDTIATDACVMRTSHAMTSPRGRGRGKRRGGTRYGRGSSSAKKLRVDEELVEPTPAPVISPPVVAEPPADANCILKFTYGINAYKHWAIQKNAHLEQVGPPKAGMRQRLFKLDLLQCSADELNYALCLFVKEVRKPNGEEYAPDSIYYLCLGIQEYLYENGRIDNIFTDFFYEKFTECLNEVLGHYEVRLNAQGMLVCRIEEEHLWEAKQLGAHSPHVLLNTLIYFNTKHFMLRSSEDHLGLSFSHIMKHWKKTTTPSGKPGRSVYLRYYAPSQLGGDASQKRKKEELPVFEQAENADNPLRCPVKLYEFYLSKCPESIKNRSDVFYLVPERSCVPDSPVWYSAVSLGLEAMARMLNRLRVIREIQESQLTSLAVPYYN